MKNKDQSRDTTPQFANLADGGFGTTSELLSTLTALRKATGPAMRLAIQVYESERALERRQEFARLNEKYPAVALRLDSHTPAQATPRPSTHTKRRSVRIYGAAILELQQTLPDRWRQLDFSVKISIRNWCGLVSIGKREPYEFFEQELNFFKEALMHYALTVHDGHMASQRAKAKKATEARWGHRESVNAIVGKLARHRDSLGDFTPTDELWPLFYSELESAGLHPTDNGERISWQGNERGVTQRTFANKISSARRK